MTGMLASVRSVDEALEMLPAGVDILDLKDPDTGALGALDPATLRQIVKLVDGRVTVSATVGDLPWQGDILQRAVDSTAQCGVNIVKVGVFGDAHDPEPLRMLAQPCHAGVRVVLVLLAELYNPPLDFQGMARSGIHGVMLDTRDKDGVSLTGKLRTQELKAFVSGARAAGLRTGLAGALTGEDVPELKLLGADYLGFRGALCRQGKRDNALDLEAVACIQTLLKGAPSVHTRLSSSWDNGAGFTRRRSG